MKKIFILSLLLFLSNQVLASTSVKAQDNLEIYFSPDPLQNFQPWIKEIQSAKKSIQMVIFHINDKEVVNALIQAAQRGVKVQVIVDRLSLMLPPFSSSKKKLEAGGVEVTACTKGFKITHQKSLVVDGTSALVTSMNLTKKVDTTRDWIIATTDPKIINEMNQVFATDLQNANTGAGNTPELTNANLLWSPVNSEQKLIQLINKAQHTIVSTVENLGSSTIQAAFTNAVKRGVKVRMISPLCNKASAQATSNVSIVQQMNKDGINIKLMPNPDSATQPYMHAKMIVVDSEQAYVGSVNFSDNSLHNSRELGMIFSNDKAIGILQNEFEKDWVHTISANGSIPKCSGSSDSLP